MNKFTITTLALLAGLSVSVQAQGRVMPKPVVEVGTVSEALDSETRRYTGQIVSKSVVQIIPRVSGEILEIGFQDGAEVKKGQMLYRLDPIQYDAAVKAAQAKIAECKAKLEYAQSSYDRNSSLYSKQAASRDTMENTKSSLEAFRAALLSAEAELIKAKDNLKNTVIIAPIDGVAGVTNYTVGNYLTPSSGTLVSIIQVQPVRVRFAISTADFLRIFGSIDNIRKTASVKLKLSDGSIYPVEGTIELINNEANQKTDAIQVYANFPNKNRKLMVGSTVNVTLSKKQGKLYAAVLPSAVMHDNQGSYVYVVDKNNKIEKRRVVTGNATNDLQLIITGLKKGEKVVTAGNHKTFPGAEIEPAKSGK